MHGVLTECVTICEAVGARAPLWTQGAGGNVSIKEDDTLWIKASGYRLDAARSEKGVARLALSPFLRRLAQPALSEAGYASAVRSLSDAAGGCASMESGFHSLLPQRVVIHFHPISGLLMGWVARAAPHAWKAFCDSWGCPVPPSIAPTIPGLGLSRAIARHAQSPMLVLENHGVVLQGSDATILATWAAFEAAFCEAWHVPKVQCDSPLDKIAACEGPWHVYTPDAIVFADRVRAILVPTSRDFVYRLAPDARTRDRCAWEIWVATQLARDSCPDLPQWPKSMTKVLHDLPMEAWRCRHAELSHGAQGGNIA